MRLVRLLILCFMLTSYIQAQIFISGSVFDSESIEPIPHAQIFINEVIFFETDLDGKFSFNINIRDSFNIKIGCLGYTPFKNKITSKEDSLNFPVFLELQPNELSSIDLIENKDNKYQITRLRSVHNTSIYVAKKNEVILMNQAILNTSTNNARQIYSRVPGLNIWESNSLGIQLEIGARGLSPQRTSNFNTRQNGYDISADALGYPESYYVPPSEAIEQIQIVRGAASLQYGTQFGGLLNFVLKSGSEKSNTRIFRQSLGSFGLKNTFLSLAGNLGKCTYYTFYQNKQNNGWRENSQSTAQTYYLSSKYKINSNFKIGYEFTHMSYLSKQPGGMNDLNFYANPDTSFRSRNWFKVNWNVAAFHLDYKFNIRSKLNSRFFGLLGFRDALGVLNSDYVPDSVLMILNPNRDLQTASFKNIGNETRFIHRYLLIEKESVLLLGFRIYRGVTNKQQGNANDASGPDFYFENKFDYFGTYYDFPSFNSAFFLENLIFLNDKFSITPGFRFDRIITMSNGYFHGIVNDNLYFFKDEKRLARNVFLSGLGISFKLNSQQEIYSNFSENYRAINFNDMQVINSNLVIDPNLRDESGFNLDFGFRGKYRDFFEFDLSLFYLNYSDRIGFLSQYYNPDNAPSPNLVWTSYLLSSNIGNSKTFGVESYLSWVLFNQSEESGMSSLIFFVNGSIQRGVYVSSQENSIVGKQVELNPNLNLKFGLQYFFKSFSSSLLYSYTSSQFSDAQNTIIPSNNGLFGEIPSYTVLDFSVKYRYKRIVLESGVNNLLNTLYFTRRASAYPGTGIIPADIRNTYVSLQIKF